MINLTDEVLTELGYNPDNIGDVVYQRVTSYIERGTAYINNVAGVEVDYEADLLARQLMIAYCRYANAQCENLFSENYRSDLLELNCNYLGAVDDDIQSE